MVCGKFIGLLLSYRESVDGSCYFDLFCSRIYSGISHTLSEPIKKLSEKAIVLLLLLAEESDDKCISKMLHRSKNNMQKAFENYF